MKLKAGTARSILERWEAEEDREKVSLYLSKSIYDAFKGACGKAPASRVMESLMVDFMDQLGVDYKKKKK